jgi:hypothetical protein
LKEIEIDDDSLYGDIYNTIMSDFGNNIVSNIEEVNPGLNVAQPAVLLLQVRPVARMEVGNKDQINF